MFFVLSAGAQTTYYSKPAATNFADVASWGSNTDGSGTSPASISSADNFIVANNSALMLDASAVVRALTISSGSLTVAANTLTVAIPSQFNSTLAIAGGTFTVSGGSVVVNGNFALSGTGVLNQSGGTISVDGNNGGSATNSVAAATPIVSFSPQVNYNITLSGGTFTVVDPHVGAQYTVQGNMPFAGQTAASGTHTFRFGDGISSDAGGARGFNFYSWFGTGIFKFNNVVIESANGGTNRFVLTNGSFENFAVAGNLTINSGGEYRNTSTSTTTGALYVAGNLTNNGTLTTLGGTIFANVTSSSATALTVTPSAVAQTVSGTGVYRNNVSSASSTANFAQLVVNNISAAGVTFADANTLLSANTVANTGTASTGITFTQGMLNLAGGTFILGVSTATTGSLTYTSGGFSNGSVKRFFSASSLTSTLSSSLPVFPFMVNGAARHVFMAKSATWVAGGSITATYTHAVGSNATSYNDFGYMIDRQSAASWSFTTANGLDLGATTLSVGLAGEGIFALNSSPGTVPRLMQASSAIGGHVAGSGSQTAPIANRSGLSAADLTGSSHYIGVATADLGYYTIASGNWENPAIWSTGIVPTLNDIVTIVDGHTVTINSTAASAKTVFMTGASVLDVTGSSLTIASPVSFGIVFTTGVQAQLNVAGGTVNIGTGAFRYSGLQNNGRLTVSSGTLNVNGYLVSSSSSVFNQSGGLISIDQNAAGSTTNSYTAGAGLQMATPNVNLTGGTILMVDPNPAATNTPSFVYSGAAASYASPSHTVQFGDGVSTDAGNAGYGFRFTLGSGNNLLVLGSLKVDALNNLPTITTASTGRVLTTATNLFVNGDVDILSGEMVQAASTTLFFAKSINNAGTLTTLGTLANGITANLIITTSPNAQSIGGAGFYRNGTTTVTAGATNLTFNNSGGVTLNTPLSVSGTLTLTFGVVNTSNTNLLTLGTATSAGTLTLNTPGITNMIKGPFARMIPASQTGTTTYIFPVGKSAYNPYDLVNPVTTSGGAVKVVAEAFDGSTGGTPGSAFSAISNSRYWQVSIASGAANFTSSRMRLNDATGSFNAIGSSATQTGTYNLVGGGLPTVTTTSITSAVPATTALDGFYLMATTAPPTISNLVATMQAGDRCAGSIARDITVDVTPAGGAITTVVISYSINGGAAQTVSMTNTSGNSWAGTIPPVTPANALVSWSVIATDANGLAATASGTSYRDNPLGGVTMSLNASPTAVCEGGSTTLTASSTGTGSSATYATPPAVTNATTDEDLGNVKISQGPTTILNNTTARNSLVGTIGTATGTVGGFSNFTAFGPYGLTAGQAYTFSVSSVQDGANAFGHSIAIYIDYNRDGDFGDAGEQVYTSAANTTGAHTETGSFTVPSSAYNGNTRMRVITNEGLITSPTQAVSWGEYEEYMLNITSTNTGGPFELGSYAFAGTGYFDNSNTTSVSLTPAATNTYVVQGYELADMGGCATLPSSGITVTVNPLPSAPTATNSTHCGTAVPTASVASTTGLPTPTFKWYDAASAGTLLQSSTSTTYTTAISSTTTFYVSELNAATGCESATRTAVTVTVTAPDAVAATNSTTGSICPGTPVTLTATQTGSTNTYTYTWTATPAAGSGIPTSQTGASISVTPTAGGTYAYTVTAVDGSCTTTSTTNVTVTAPPAITTATGPASVCPSSPVALAATSVNVQPGTITLGNGTGTNGESSAATAAYPTWYGNGRQQYLIPASELTALGLAAGNLTSLSFDVVAADGDPATLNEYTIKIGTTNASSITTFQTPASQVTVWGPLDYTPVVGMNTHTFTTPFNWDGTSNLIVEVCFSSDVTGNGSALTTITPTGYSANVWFQVDGATTTACTSTTVSGTASARPNMVFAGQKSTDITNSANFSWTWNPGGLTGASVTATSPANNTAAPVNQVYTVTLVDNTTTCSSTAQVTVSVNPTPSAPTASNSSQCGTAVPTASVTSTSGAATPAFKWYDAPSAGNMLQSSTSTTYTTSISSTTTFYVAEVSAAGCESDRTAVTVTVTSPDAVTASADGPVCAGTAVNLLATQTGSTNTYTYTWSATPSTGSGIGASPVTGASVAVTPTAAGTYAYLVTAVDGSCTTTSTVTVTVNGNPTINSATGPASVCSNAPVALTTTVLGVGAGNASIGTATTTVGGTGISPFSQLYESAHSQYLIRASDLLAAGLRAGNITSVSFNVTTASSTLPFTNYTMKMANTAATNMTGLLSPTFTTVYNPQGYPAVSTTGAKTVTFNTPFNWDGTSNVLMDICFFQAPDQWSGSSTVSATTKGYTAVWGYYQDGTNACGTTGANSASGTALPDMTFAGQTVADVAASYNITWNPGGLTGASVTATSPANNTAANVNQVYTVTVADPSTGCSSTSQVTVAVKPVVTAPTASNSVQCGTGVPTASVASTTGAATPTFKWYSAASAGTMLQSGTSATYTTSINATTTFYVSEYDAAAGCESDRTAVTVTVNQPDAVTASSNGPVCMGTSVNLSVAQTGSTNTYTYTWSASPATGSGIGASPVTGATATVTPTAAGTYVYTVTAVDGPCTTTSTVSVTVNANPNILTTTATPTSVCSGGSVLLSATTGSIQAGSVAVGTETTSGQAGSPYRSGLGSDYKAQYLFTAAELHAAGLSAGNITSIAFNVTAVGTGAMPAFTIKMGQTSATSLTATFDPATLTTVLNPATYTAVAGVNTHNLGTPFTWDGTSSLIVQVCHNSVLSGSSSVSMDTPPATMVTLAGVAGACSVTTGATNPTRPIITFGGQALVNTTPNYSFVWTPGNLSGATVNATTPAMSGVLTYTVKATDLPTGCFSTNTVNVTVGATLVPNGSATPATICVGSSSTLTAAPTGGGAPFTYSWKDASNNVISTSASFSVAPLSTTTYTLSVTDNCGTTQTQPVTVTVTAPPTVSINEASPVAVCATSANLTSTTDAATPSYVWNFNGSPAGVTTANYTVNASGSYTVKVTDGVTGCSSTSAAVTVNLQTYPTSVAVTPSSAATICLGQSQTITASATFANGPVAIMSEDFNGVTPANFTISNGAGASNTVGAWTMRTSPYTYGTLLTNVTIDGSKFILANSDEAGSGATTEARLTSNAFSTVGYTGVTVNFKHFYRSVGSVTFAGVEYSTNGTTWTTVPSGAFNATSSTGGANNPPTITAVSLNLPAAAIGQPSVRIRFRYDAGWDYYWGIDDVRITGNTSGNFAWASTTGAGIPGAGQSADPANNSISVTPTAAGTFVYTVTASVPGNSCTNTATVTINVLTPSTAPTMLNSSASGATCASSNVILTQTGGSLGDGAHWQWYRDAGYTLAVGPTTTAANAQITVAPSATTTYYLRAEGGTAPCASNISGAASVTVTVATPLTASIAAAQPVLCETGSVATLNITGGPANGSVTVTTNGANQQTINLDGSGAASFNSDPLNANATFTITSVSDGTCTTNTNTSAIVYVGVLIANPINNHSECNGTSVAAIPFAGNFPAGTQYSWTSTNPAIGLAQTSGTGTSLPSFTATNSGTTEIFSDISVTPILPGSECKIRAMVFRITVRPTPSINGVGNQTVCAGTMTAAVTFSGATPGTSFTWTNSNPAIGMAASGGGNLPAFIAQNSTASATISGTFTVTPHAVGCAGTPTTFTITVNRSAASLSYPGSPYCQGGTVNPILSGTRGGTFSSTVGLTIDGATGQVNLGQSQPGTYTITYTAPASGGACGGVVSTQITIKPQATVNNIGNQVYCNGMVTAPIAFTGTATNYAWSTDNTSIGLAASGTGTSLPSFTTVNGGPATQYAYVAVMPLGNGTSTCNGRAVKFRIAVNFCPPITQAGGTGGGSATARMASQVVVGPNPTTNRVTINYTGTEAGPFTVQLLTQFGQVMSAPVSFTGNTYTLDLTGRTPGVYMIRLINTRTNTMIQKQIVKL